MKKEIITCDVIQDLLPLYEDECCSEQSRKIVEEHLAECAKCREKSCAYQKKLPSAAVDEDPELKEFKKGMKKITRWKRLATISFSLLLLLVFLAYPAWNYVRGEGITYANLRAVYDAYTFKSSLLSGDYEKAYGLLDIQYHYDELLAADPEVFREDPDGPIVMEGIHAVEENGFDWYEETCREKFFRSMAELEELNEALVSCSNFRIERLPGAEGQPQRWAAYFDARTSSGKAFELRLDIQKDGIFEIYTSTGYLTYNAVSGEEIVDEELARQDLMLSRFYRFPSINETVMEMLYDGTTYDWRLLFSY